MFLLIFLFWLRGTPVQAWNGHKQISAHALSSVQGLDQVVEKTPYTYDIVDNEQYNPSFELKYLLKELPEIRAYDVLVSYAQEPDWGLDSDLELHTLQILTGGSQGWRHQRYTIFGGQIAFGTAPQRAQHFYDLAQYAYSLGDTYWAYRFLSRSMHYLMDMGQPLHSLPLPTADFVFQHKLSLKKAARVGENVHHNLESFILSQLTGERQSFIDALEVGGTKSFGSVSQGAVELNQAVRPMAERQYFLVLKVWPDLAEPTSIRMNFSNYVPNETNPHMEELLSIIGDSLTLTAQYSRGLIEKFQAENC